MEVFTSLAFIRFMFTFFTSKVSSSLRIKNAKRHEWSCSVNCDVNVLVTN